MPPYIQAESKWYVSPTLTWAQSFHATNVPLHPLHPHRIYQPLRTNGLHADYFPIPRKVSEEFDGGSAKKYDEDLNSSPIFVSHSLQPFRGDH
jgi:hypothetical protein